MNQMKFIKEEIYQALQYQRTYNTSLTRAAEKYRVDRHTLSAYQNFDFATCIYVPEEQQYIQLTPNELQAVQEYQSGILPTVLAVKQKFGFHTEKFRKMCQYMGVPTRQDNIKYHFNRNAFRSIQTEEDAYILGFITADGYLCEARNALRFKLHARDVDILHKINHYLQSNNPITYHTHAITHNPQCCLEFNDKTIIQNLKQFGLHQAKSLQESFCQTIPQPLMRHYIRGLIDGDGFISKKTCHIGLCGTHDIVYNVAQQIQKHNVVAFDVQRKIRCEITKK